MHRPEGALSPEELGALLDKHGKVRVYMGHPRSVWRYFTIEKYYGTPPQYYCITHNGERYKLDWNGVCYGMNNWIDHHVFTNFWLYYAHMLRQGKHEQLLP